MLPLTYKLAIANRAYRNKVRRRGLKTFLNPERPLAIESLQFPPTPILIPTPQITNTPHHPPIRDR
jgi:hypothetical protein